MPLSVYLTIRSQSKTPDELTKYLGLIPDMARVKGGKNRAGQTPYKENVWSLKSPLDESTDLNTQLNALVTTCTPLRHKLQSLADSCTIDLDCHLEIHQHEAPVLSIVNEVLRFFAEINANIEFDYYDLREDAP